MSSGIRNRNTRLVLIGGFLLLLTTALVRLVSATPALPFSAPPAGPQFVTTQCADLVVLGLRGSGQSLTKNAGVGEEVLKSVQNMAARLHTKADETVRLEAVTYRAERAATLVEYQAGVNDGRRKLGSQFTKLSKDCPSSKLAVVGFSQGAQAVHEFSYDLTAEQSRNLVLVGLIADPVRNPADSVSTWSYADTPAREPGKLGAGPRFSPDTRDKVITFCLATDEVCNRPETGGLNTLSETHKKFYEKAGTVRSTGQQLNTILHRNGVG